MYILCIPAAKRTPSYHSLNSRRFSTAWAWLYGHNWTPQLRDFSKSNDNRRFHKWRTIGNYLVWLKYGLRDVRIYQKYWEHPGDQGRTCWMKKMKSLSYWQTKNTHSRLRPERLRQQYRSTTTWLSMCTNNIRFNDVFLRDNQNEMQKKFHERRNETTTDFEGLPSKYPRFYGLLTFIKKKPRWDRSFVQ